jgi:hypothetical protein
MKSAYELAMERLAKQSPAVKLTAAQKTQLAELDSLYKSKIAEREIALQTETAKAVDKGDYEELPKLEAQIKAEKAKLQAEWDEKKEKVRQGK